MINSANKMGKPINIVNIKKISKKTPPPDLPAIYGNFQIAPNPIADPAVAKIKPSFEAHCSCCFIFLLLVHYLQTYLLYLNHADRKSTRLNPSHVSISYL